MKKNDALIAVFVRNAFYKQIYYWALAIFVLAIFVITILVGILFYIVKHPPLPLFFATDDSSRLIHVIPVNVPNMSNDQVMQWTIQAVQQATSYDYNNYHAQLQSAQKYFNNYGWYHFMNALTASNNLLALTNRKQIVISQVVDTPKLLAQGLLAGSYAWKFQMPLLVSYWQPPYDKAAYANAEIITVIVQRQPVLASDHGLSIVELIATMATSGMAPQEISSTPTG